ncbi:hypothetical protein PQ462_09740 [Flavobacterium sp. KACC 22758]|uniref:YobI family P-loop NTPase n=1 Tax=Flavobacterium sp. KACC 22758 TaxID=3025667 RepID=UPI0023662183|nr:hypothetical protein [Flavobacterium sp. KACC 22758]WDF61653.1 hypothetical protein PQ462_09740 [Flavobacterium sp. KACC 22758]
MKQKLLYNILTKCNLLLTKLIYRLDKKQILSRPSKFDSLTPIDNANNKEIYFIALKEALENDDIKNIALTGTYGSGKSSIIKTFQKNYSEYIYLNISLASFKDIAKPKQDDDENVNRLIELSILQQIFYKEKHNDIPDSRFKRIKNIDKNKILLNSFLFLIWSLSLVYLFKRNEVSKDFSEISIVIDNPYFKYVTLIICLMGLYYLSIKLVRIFNNSKLNKLNIQSADIEIGDNSDKSILNHHLDEILYFFEVTNYEIVVIEDLDRFDDTEIFTKLRELNNLINGSKQINRKIVFLYAIRDNMFQDKDRTKFFDFIIPVIPIINPSNSNEIIKNKISRLKSTNVPTDEFIDDVSIFIEDMRLLTNICNEYSLYKDNLGQKLNQNNLFAIIIYKNLCPDDFADLHNGKGHIYKLITDKTIYIKDKINIIDKAIIEYKNQITDIENEEKTTIKELRAVYIQELIKQVPDAVSIKLNNSDCSFTELFNDENFNLLKKITSVKYNFYTTSYHNNSMYSITTNTIAKLFSEIENSVNENHTYDERVELINNKNNNKINQLKLEIEKCNIERNEIKSWSLKEIFKSVSISTIISKSEIKNQKLVSYLLVNGFINENYYDYISYFHEGSITKQDWEFLQNVKSETITNYDFKLINLHNLIKKISANDFEKEAILNYSLIDYLLKHKESFQTKLNSVFTQLSNEKEETFNFIKGYIEEGENKFDFIKILCKKWPDLWKYIEEKSLFTDEKKDDYLKLILKYSDLSDIKSLSKNSELNHYIESKGNFSSFINDEIALGKIEKTLKVLEIRFINIENPNINKEIFNSVYSNRFYIINISNIKIILEYCAQNLSNFEQANYTTIQNSNCQELKSYIEENLNYYLSEVLLKLPNNNFESEENYIRLLNNSAVSPGNILALINKTDTLITDIKSINRKGIDEILLNSSKILPVWSNLYKYFQDKEKKIDPALTTFLNYKKNYVELSKNIISPSKDEDYPLFRQHIMLCPDLTDEAFSYLIESISHTRDKLSFENLSVSKVKHLIRKVLTLSVENYNLLRKNFANQHIDLLIKYPTKYISEFDQYAIDNEDLLLILTSEIFLNNQKIDIILKVDKDLIIEDVETSDKVCEILANNPKLDLNYDFIKNLFCNAKDIYNRLKIFNIYFNEFSKINIDELLQLLPYPYSAIAIKGKRPEIGITNTDRELVQNLLNIKYISSKKDFINRIKVNTKAK